VQHHRQAADLLADRPEAAAAHAAAAGQPLRAVRAWLRAGEESLRRWAAPDAEAFLDRALATLSTVEDPGRVELGGRLHLARGRAREARGAFDGAWADHQEAVALAREAGDQRLEMAALRQLGGDVLVGQGRPITLCVSYLEAGVRIAHGLGDRVSETDLLGRLAVVSANQLRFDLAVRHGTAAVAIARAAAEPEALAAALDGLKTAYAYLGDVARLGPVLAELEPLLRSQGDLWRLQWAVLESAFPAVARGDWDAAAERIATARTLNRRSRFGAYEAWFVVHGGWVERLRGNGAAAVAAGREAVAVAARDGSGHPWWPAAAYAFLGATLLAGGDRAEAVPVLETSVRLASDTGADGYLLRGLAPLAEATGDRDLLDRADGLLAGVTAPAGGAWLLGADAYLAVARAWLAAGAPERAAAVLDRFLPAAQAAGWPVLVALGSALAGEAAGARGDAAAARRLAERAATLAARHGVALPRAQTSSASSAAARAAAPGSTGR
jgi:tetratricopeptide (TPR) repeat protein